MKRRSKKTDQGKVFEADQLRDVIEELKNRHKKEIEEKNQEISELKSTLKLKQRVEVVTHTEFTTNYFPKFVLTILGLFDKNKKLSHLYVQGMSLFNYIFVCGIGVLINMFVIHRLVHLLPLWLANTGAILIAFLWNWNFSVGPLGYLFGLSPRKKKVKKT